jgi:hypothetical protein
MKLRLEDDGAQTSEARKPNNHQDNAFGPVASAIGARNLMIIIVTMPLVFLIVVVGILAIFGAPDNARKAQAAETVRSISPFESDPGTQAGPRAILPLPAASDAAPALTLPAGARAGAIALDGDRLAVRIDSDDRAMIVIYDLAADAVVKSISLVGESDE